MFYFELTTKKILKWIAIPCLFMQPIFLLAAKPIDLRKQNISVLAPFLTSPVMAIAENESKANTNNLDEINRSVDFNHTLHIRVQQTYKGYTVWGTDSIVHIKKADSPNLPLMKVLATTSKNVALNGMIYQDLNADLQNEPSYIFTEAQKDKALSQTIRLYGQPKKTIANKLAQLIIYIDNNKKAHWSYLTSFTADDKTHLPDKMIYIIDAIDFTVFQHWNNTQTLFEDVKAGGTGGNERTGKIFYDGLQGHYPVLDIKRDPLQKVCHLRNDKVVLRNLKNGLDDITFNCDAPDKQHNNLYWNEEGMVNGAFSPERDALYAAGVTANMYEQWYHTPAWPDKNGSPKKIMVFMHQNNVANASQGGGELIIGDGDKDYYPFASLGVMAHEISHGFTASEQNSKLIYYGQSGGLNESFSDMAYKAVEFFSMEKNLHWNINDQAKDPSKWDRYMDEPTKDCTSDQKPGDHCSIDNVNQYSDNVDVHYSSGIFNKAFYLIATSPEWDTRKAFAVMVQANQHYWTATTTFCEAAHGVLNAANDYHYDSATLNKAFLQVGIDTDKCS